MTYQELWHRLTSLYAQGEAQAIVRMVLNERFGMSLADIYSGKVTELSANDTQELEKIMLRLEKGEPVQYVLGQATFCQYIYKVCPDVLIPRPETAELVEWIVGGAPRHVLDIGTGSGCIAITLALKLPQAQVEAWDISEKALAIAQENARRLGADVSFVKRDVLAQSAALSQPLPEEKRYDLIVSNPPYICEKEKAEMERNVLDYEPALALFVPDDDPLLFYRSIALVSMKSLKNEGKLYFEINPLYADQICGMLRSYGFYDVEVRDDAFGKQRFVKAVWRMDGCRWSGEERIEPKQEKEE